MVIHLRNTKCLQCLCVYPVLSYTSLSFFCSQQGNILENLRICSMSRFVRFLHDTVPTTKSPSLVVTNMCFGTIPVRLFQPKVMSSKLQRGIVYYHGGGAIFGSLGG